MRDDPEYWDALSTRIIATVRARRQPSWLRLGLWAPPLATAAALMLFLASRRAPGGSTNGAPNIATMLTAQDQRPSIVMMLGGQP